MVDTERVDPRLVELILGNIAEGVFTVNRQFRITFFNTAAEQITGFSRNEVLGKMCADIFRTPICSRDCPLRQSIRTGQTVKNFEINILTREDRAQPISVCTAPLIDSEGHFLGGVETFRDMSSIKQLRREISNRYTFQDIISKNARLRQIFETLPNIAQTDATILIQGRSGTGKELFATAIHNISPRAAGPLIKVNCGALPESLLESELFGYVKGAFTDARNDRLGRFQAAHEGTIFLDEIGELPLALQVKLLRVLQENEIRPIGESKSMKIDARVIAATAKNLEEEVQKGNFREDLYYRLNVLSVKLPPLKDRAEDIPLLCNHFIRRFNEQLHKDIQGISSAALSRLLAYSWPGNVRELENAIERAVVLSEDALLTPEHFSPDFIQGSGNDPMDEIINGYSLKKAQKILEEKLIKKALNETNGNRTQASRLLEISHPSLLSKIKAYNISL